MKRTFIYFAWLLPVVMLIACSEQNGVDQRDKLVGAYTFTSSGSLDFAFMGESMSIPLDGEGNFSIAKAGKKNKVIFAVFNDSIYATLSGNEIQLDNDSYTMSMEGMSLEVKIANDKITIDGEQLKWTTDLTATVKYEGLGISGSGDVSMTGNKIEQENK